MALYNPLLVKRLEQELEKHPESKSFCSLAQIHFANNELKKAEQICLKGMAHNPSYSPAYILLSRIYKKKGQSTQAIQLLNQAKELNPDNPNIYKILGEIYKQQKDLKNTLKAYKMVAFLKPEDQTAQAIVQHLEKLLASPLSEKPSQTTSKESSFRPLNRKDSQKLALLNRILARVEIYKTR